MVGIFVQTLGCPCQGPDGALMALGSCCRKSADCNTGVGKHLKF